MGLQAKHISVRPLRRWRTIAKDEHGIYVKDGTIAPRYGDRSYLTDDMLFTISCTDAWHIKANAPAIVPLITKLADTGLFQTPFPRRKDAVAALEQTLGEIAECE